MDYSDRRLQTEMKVNNLSETTNSPLTYSVGGTDLNMGCNGRDIFFSNKTRLLEYIKLDYKL